MVIGNGLVAKAFSAYEHNNEVLIFASGVSNSQNTDKALFAKEETLLKKSMRENPEKTLVYIGTCSVYDKSLEHSAYVMHKLAMEQLIKSTQQKFHIFRISNLVGKTHNPHTVFNYFIQHIAAGTFFYVWKNASRNIIDIDDAVKACSYIIDQQLHLNEVMNIANPHNYAVPEIVETIETVEGKKGNYKVLSKGSSPEIDTSTASKIYTLLNINFDGNYLLNTIKKYFTEI